MSQQAINVGEAKKHLSEILGRVAYRKEQIIITKRGKPLAKLVPVEEETQHLSQARGWLDEKDEFFGIIDRIVQDRQKHIPRILREQIGK